MRFSNQLKKIVVLLSAAASVSVVSITNSKAESTSELYLKMIAENTYNILAQVNNLPTYLYGLAQLTYSWMQLDNDASSSFIYQTQGNFASLGYWFSQTPVLQNSLQAQVMADALGQPVASLTQPATSPAILNILPNINDVSYTTVLGKPPAPKAEVSAYNYVKNAAGLNIKHLIPTAAWEGRPDDLAKYFTYYTTITSIESFNGYVLTNLAAESQSNNPQTTLQNTLVSQASASSWLAQIATEELGKVLRQILLFQSQTYVLLTQQLQMQKQLLTAQVMTNSLLIVNNQPFEMQMAQKARSTKQMGV